MEIRIFGYEYIWIYRRMDGTGRYGTVVLENKKKKGNLIMRKFNLKKIAAFVLAGTMAIGMSATVFAAYPSGDALKDKEKFTKTFITDGDTYQPAATFTFTQPTGVDPTPDEKVSGIPVSNGGDGPAVTLGEAKFEAATTIGPETADVPITYGDDLTKVVPGVYKYSFSEEASSNTNIKCDTTTKYLYVFVALDKEGKKTITGASMTDGKSKVAGISNEYGKDKDDKDTLHDLTITKKITGDMANVDATFTFKVKVTSADGKAKYKVVVTRNGVVDSNITSIDANTETSINKIGKDDTIKIYSLAKGDTYTVEEVEANTNGYTTKINEKDDKDGIIIDKVLDADVEVKYDNHKEAASPTGIIMNYAPYIAMLAAACVLAVVFFNRRREDA